MKTGSNKRQTCQDESTLLNYQRAQSLAQEIYTESMVLNDRVFPHWIGNSSFFWYGRKIRIAEDSAIKLEFRLVDAQSKRNTTAFDHDLLAKALSAATGRKVNSDYLPISHLSIDLHPREVKFAAFDKYWLFDELKKSCRVISDNRNDLVSPNGKKAAFVRDFNIWVRDLNSGEERALTNDGQRYCAYAVQPERFNLTNGLIDGLGKTLCMPEALWSSDSKKLLTVLLDEREVLSMPVIQYIPNDGSVRPQCVHAKYALPGDKAIAEYRFIAIDIEAGEICDADYPRVLDSVLWHGPFSGGRAWWSSDGHQAYFVDMDRGQQCVRIVVFNTCTGASRILFEESSDSYIDLNLDFEHPALLYPLPETDELIWFSERSGWGHLYLYNLKTGELKNSVTSGDWLVREILHIDNEKREALILIAGRRQGQDPYYREICRVNIDTGILNPVVSGPYDCVVPKVSDVAIRVAIMLNQAAVSCSGVSGKGEYLVITRTRADEVPETELVDRNGKLVMTIERTDISGLPADWHWPEPVKMIAADDQTDIYGLIFKPSYFSPNDHYPVLNWANSNPFYAAVPKGAFRNNRLGGLIYMSAAAFAELGFIVVLIDGRGTCHRSKAFHCDTSDDVDLVSNMDDQVVGIQQLAQRFSYLDLNRVGIVDICGSNSPIHGLLAYPDFYKVGAVCSVWDAGLLIQSETYHGSLPASDCQQFKLGKMVGNLKGKLLIMHGMLDPYFPVCSVFQMVEALVRENKDFDLVLLPNGGHSTGGRYGLRRIWDYLVANLQGAKPPSEFRLNSGLPFALEKK